MKTYELINSDEKAAAADAETDRLVLAVANDDDVPLSLRKVDLEGGGAKNGQQKATPGEKRGQHRLVSLDVFRGLTVALMIFVDDVGTFLPAVNHSPWDGVNLADFVMPFFLFIVGVALALTYKRVANKRTATKKAVFRALKLFVVGIIVQGGYFHGLHNLTYGVDIMSIRWTGILQRIAVAYLLTAILEIWLKSDADVESGYSLVRRYRYQLLVGLFLTSVYMILLYGLYVPDWEYQIPVAGSSPKSFSVKCGMRGDTGPACNAVGMIDRQILGIQHLHRHPIYERTKQCSINSPANGPPPPDAPSWCQAPFDPEGLLSSVMAIVTCLIGLQFGHVIVHFTDHKDRIVKWMIPSFYLLALAFSFDFFGIRMNKALYTLSYTFATAGAAGMLFTGVYVLVDVCGYRKPTLAMEWLGMHALMIYILIGCNILPVFIQGFYWKEPENNLLKVIGIGSQ
ncbi:heparan-alpha-glucosaminide N-acetyltransferase-like isoform X1 [Canna indica]|uniref:Heparan-alpha-glucosaminide N-acetyltransferase-like isoform X1 n=1 Tax=Canna indica TaxID=4628 RepID=A0AAQ3Q8R4_9LILI|nr:heparan-alpha-glucosaminide N-acetyltransferase-like isoform X1 [Canna indica]